MDLHATHDSALSTLPDYVGYRSPAQYFRQRREVVHDIILTPSISPKQGKGVYREVYYRLPSSSFASAGRPSRITYRPVCEVTE